jgi:hypothetical protein
MTSKDRIRVYPLLSNIVWQSKRDSFHDCEIVAGDIVRILYDEGYEITKRKRRNNMESGERQ